MTIIIDRTYYTHQDISTKHGTNPKEFIVVATVADYRVYIGKCTSPFTGSIELHYEASLDQIKEKIKEQLA